MRMAVAAYTMIARPLPWTLLTAQLALLTAIDAIALRNVHFMSDSACHYADGHLRIVLYFFPSLACRLEPALFVFKVLRTVRGHDLTCIRARYVCLQSKTWALLWKLVCKISLVEWVHK